MISHGYNVKNEHDALVRAADDATDQIGILLTPGTFVVDLIPMRMDFLPNVVHFTYPACVVRFLPRWVPFHLKAQRWKALLHKMTDDSYTFAKAAMVMPASNAKGFFRLTSDNSRSKEESCQTS